MTAQLVYFIRATESGRVKIGIAANPYKRLADLQVGSPERLELLGAVPGGRRLETDFHRRLHHHRIHGEWFGDSDRVVLAVGDALGWGRPTAKQSASAANAQACRAELASLSGGASA